ncbi:MAG: aconitase X catalytic domain-containing protein [Oscillospiraceae bacterium]|jgi:predicted aconitase|nr:aconitase X catalytic domain-containing protein [Oscillospiraceae bacterium]
MAHTIFLTDEEKRLLDGGDGLVAQKCMQYLVEVCQVSGAERLIDLDGTGDFHSPMTSMAAHYEFPIEELEKIVAQGAHFKIPTFANKAPFYAQAPIHGWEKCNLCAQQDPAQCQSDPEFHKIAMRDEWYELYRKMGMLTSHSCANYMHATYLPTIGQHCSWNESSAVPYCNAVLGARSNIDGSFATCYLGKAAYYDMHITENRYATVLVKTERLIKSDIEWDVFGFAVGEDAGVHVPVLTGTGKPTTTQFMKLNSAMNTGGAVRMYHIPGSTPEAPTLEAALGGKQPKRETMVGERELKKAYDTLNYRTGDDVDMVYLGCPHLTVVDLMLLARKLEGKKLRIPLWIMTAPWLYEVARSQGYLKIYEDAGAHVLTGTCLAAMGAVPDGVKRLAVDSAKQSYYITGCYPDDDNRLEVCYGTTDDCIDSAVTGKWRGEWR